MRIKLKNVCGNQNLCNLQDAPYAMDLPKLGHAVIINNIAKEIPGTNEDVKALKEAYKTVGFEVQIHQNCSVQVSKESWFVKTIFHSIFQPSLCLLICSK